MKFRDAGSVVLFSQRCSPPGLGPLGARVAHNGDLERQLGSSLGTPLPKGPVAHLAFDASGALAEPTRDNRLIQQFQQHSFVERWYVPRGGETRTASFFYEQREPHA